MTKQAHTTITAAEIIRRKTLLESKLKELRGFSREREELRVEYLADPLDQVRSSTDREIAIQRVDQQTHLIQGVQEALTKIEEGTYGLCERCDSPIPRKRLDAIPWAGLCAPCQSERESAGYGVEPTLKDAA